MTGMAFCFIPPGTFTMGSPKKEVGRSDDEVRHRVALTQGFYLGKYPVTQAQWARVMRKNPVLIDSWNDFEGLLENFKARERLPDKSEWEKVMRGNPSHFKGSDLPVESVSRDDCQGFLTKFGAGARLPTETEWEYACRAGTTTALNSGKELTSTLGWCPNLDEVAWYCQNSDDKTHPVGQKQPNAWGLYDMHGLVWEMCSDLYGDYPTGSVTDPQGAQQGWTEVYRGGAWINNAHYCRAALRTFACDSGNRVGFRVVLPTQVSSAPTGLPKIRNRRY